MTKFEGMRRHFSCGAPVKMPGSLAERRSQSREQRCDKEQSGAIRHSGFGLPSCLGISSFVIDRATLALRWSAGSSLRRTDLRPCPDP